MQYTRFLPLFLAVWAANFAAAQADFNLAATGYDSHTEVIWPTPTGLTPASYKVWRASTGQSFAPYKTVGTTSLLDFTGFAGSTPDTFSYFVEALNFSGTVLANSDTATAVVKELADEELMDMVQRYTFRYFWEFGHPVSGMARERNNSGDVVTTGGTGFGIMATVVAVERGYITRQQGRDRLLQIVSFLQFADRFHGVFPHWMNGTTGDVVAFSQLDNGADLVETAFLMEGLLCARQYFDQNEPYETALREAITQLWEEVEWDFHRKNNSNVLYWHWSPDYDWQMNFQVRGYNEALIIYLLAIASPTHPVPASLWNSGWAQPGYTNGQTYYGYKLDVGPARGGPLFFAHYSYLGFDPRGIKDAYTNYYIHNKHHSLVNRAYCIANPEGHEGYSGDCWGLTASDDPWGYLAHEPTANRDNGTISPTAALSSMPYSPAESMAALKHFYRVHGERLWGPMGFFDAFNLNEDWFATSTLAIDQGPIIGMIENHRTGLLWDLFMSNPDIQPALDAIGFVEDLTPALEASPASFDLLAYPNPADELLAVEFVVERPQPVSLQLHDAQGNLLRNLLDQKHQPAGLFSQRFDLQGLPVGLYFLWVKNGSETAAVKIVKL